jgi:hypothetical protein
LGGRKKKEKKKKKKTRMEEPLKKLTIKILKVA